MKPGWSHAVYLQVAFAAIWNPALVTAPLISSSRWAEKATSHLKLAEMSPVDDENKTSYGP